MRKSKYFPFAGKESKGVFNYIGTKGGTQPYTNPNEFTDVKSEAKELLSSDIIWGYTGLEGII